MRPRDDILPGCSGSGGNILLDDGRSLDLLDNFFLPLVLDEDFFLPLVLDDRVLGFSEAVASGIIVLNLSAPPRVRLLARGSLFSGGSKSNKSAESRCLCLLAFLL